MASTTTNMGLRKWDLANDQFSFAELASNFQKLDDHDHTSGKGAQLGTNALSNLAVTAPKIAANTIDSTKLSSTINAVAIPRHTTIYALPSGRTANTYLTDEDNYNTFKASGAIFLRPSTFYNATANTTYSLQMYVISNNIAPGVTITAGVTPLTVGTGTVFGTLLTYTSPTATININANTPNAGLVSTGSTFQLPSNLFGLTLSLSGTTVNNSYAMVRIDLLQYIR